MCTGVQESVDLAAVITSQQHRHAEVVEREERALLGQIRAEADQHGVLLEQGLALAGEQLGIGVDAIVEPEGSGALPVVPSA